MLWARPQKSVSLERHGKGLETVAGVKLGVIRTPGSQEALQGCWVCKKGPVESGEENLPQEQKG